MGRSKVVEVVAGIIYPNHTDDKFLIAQRNLKKSQGGLWEFPGGKVETGETYQEALKREIKEEFHADISVGDYVGEIMHHYPEKDIKLLFYKAYLEGNEFELTEHEDYRWIHKEEKDQFTFAGADVGIFQML